MPKDQEVSDTSSSVESLLEEERRRRRKKKKKHSRDDDSERHRRRCNSRKSDKKRKKHKSSKRRKERKRYDDDLGSSSGDESYDRRRRHKRSRKDRKRRRKDEDDEDERKSNPGDNSSEKPETIRSQKLAKALHHLLLEKPEFAAELPLILIRLAGGTTFDLRQVSDPSISIGLQTVFEALEPFGVQKQPNGGMWMFKNPPGATRRDELVLLRITRSLLDDVGLTMDKIEAFEQEEKQKQQNSKDDKPAPKTTTEETIQPMKVLTFSILEKFRSKDSTLGSQLASLCMTIVEGESVSVDGIPDEELKTALESLFQACGLEKAEIEDDDDSEEEDAESDESPLMGYGLPSNGSDDVQLNLATIMAACREGPPKPKSIGPMRRPMTAEEQKATNAIYGANNAAESDDEDDGPLLPGQARKGPTPSLETIQAQAEYRALELKSVEAGVPMPTLGGREEWMINPGQHDFLSGIKSGQAIKSRGFQNKKSRGEEKVAPVHPAVQAEMDAIMKAHENARGPSLIDLHQSQKTKEKALAAAANGGKQEFNWSRDKDLDAGRRVDKDALGMILGGAATELKSKFAGGFNR